LFGAEPHAGTISTRLVSSSGLQPNKGMESVVSIAVRLGRTTLKLSRRY